MTKLHLFISCLIATGAIAALVDDAEELWADFKKKYNKNYGSDEAESERYAIFQASLARADAKNLVNGNVAFGVTRFSDLTEKEFSVLLGRKNHAVTPKQVKVRDPKSVSQSKSAKMSQYVNEKISSVKKQSTDAVDINWANFGVVTSVKNQGQCGSCWAFSASEAVESEWVMNGNGILEFSPQQIASCTTAMNGCGGGDTVAAYEYLMNSTTPGLGNEWYVPYQQSMYEGCSHPYCTKKCSSLDLDQMQPQSALAGPYAVLSGYEYATPPCDSGSCDNQDTDLLAANVLAYGPPSICVDASTWNDYVGGVLTQAACGGYSARSIDHCVQLVGFNATAPSPYWIVKNSWSTDWGNAGYIFLEYPLNTCGLANEATFVSISNSQ
eukprot:gene6290-8662_t